MNKITVKQFLKCIEPQETLVRLLVKDQKNNCTFTFYDNADIMLRKDKYQEYYNCQIDAVTTPKQHSVFEIVANIY